mgnify:CR=1 FL=1
MKCGKLNLVDLAGSENICRSGAREVSITFRNCIDLTPPIFYLCITVSHVIYSRTLAIYLIFLYVIPYQHVYALLVIKINVYIIKSCHMQVNIFLQI